MIAILDLMSESIVVGTSEEVKVLLMIRESTVDRTRISTHFSPSLSIVMKQ